MADKRLFIIETVSMHRMAYCIEAETQEDAEARFIDPTLELNEFGQTHIGENMFSVMQVDQEGYIAMFDHLNDHISDIHEKHKLGYIIDKKV